MVLPRKRHKTERTPHVRDLQTNSGIQAPANGAADPRRGGVVRHAPGGPRPHSERVGGRRRPQPAGGDSRRGGGHPICPGPGGAGYARRGLPAPGFSSAAHRGSGQRIRVPPPGGAGRSGGRPPAGGVRARRSPAAIHRAESGILCQHPDLEAGDDHPGEGIDRPAAGGGLPPAQPGGGARPVQRAGRHRGRVPAGFQGSRPCGVLGR